MSDSEGPQLSCFVCGHAPHAYRSCLNAASDGDCQCGSRKPLDLDAIEARVNAATEGPWRINGYDIDTPETTVIMGQDEQPGESWWREEDAEFIAHARQDVPALIAEVRRLRRGR